MSRTPAKFTQADINRAVRAAKAAGGVVKLSPDGTITIDPQPDATGEKPVKPVEPQREIVL